MDATIADELLVLAFDDEGRAHSASADLECALAGAILVELALAGRVDVADGMPTLLDGTALHDDELDAALERIVGEDEPRKPEWWIDKLRPGLRERMLDRLAARGWLRPERGRTLGIFPTRRFVPLSPAAAVRARLSDVVEGGAEPDAPTAALAALLDAAGLARHTFADMPRAELDARLDRLGEREWASAAVRRAIGSVQAAVIAASIVAATTAATGGG